MDTPLHNNIRSLQEKLEGLYEWLNAPELSIDEYKQVVAQVQILTRTLTQTALALEDRAAEKNHTASDRIVESLPPPWPPCKHHTHRAGRKQPQAIKDYNRHLRFATA